MIRNQRKNEKVRNVKDQSGKRFSTYAVEERIHQEKLFFLRKKKGKEKHYFHNLISIKATLPKNVYFNHAVNLPKSTSNRKSEL